MYGCALMLTLCWKNKGWSGHPVCRKRYHFIIRAASNAVEPYQRPCSRCGNLLQLSETRYAYFYGFHWNIFFGIFECRVTNLLHGCRCKSCNFAITVDDLEDWVYLQIEDNTHLLHGVVHSNGYGHLLTLSGREGGSKLLSGFDIMDFWDRLCTSISVRFE